MSLSFPHYLPVVMPVFLRRGAHPKAVAAFMMSACHVCAASVWFYMFRSKFFCMWCLQRSGINSSDVEILTLNNVTEEDAGEYICKVSNYIGEASQSGWLTVIPGNH